MMNYRPSLSKPALALLTVTTAFEALRMGASVFRGLIDLPARARIGPVAFADLSRATDLSTAGFVFYVIYGIGGALLTCAMWIVAVRTRAPIFVRRLSGVSAACSLLILGFTTQAAPLMFRVGSSANDAATLTDLLDGFAFWTYLRLLCACVSFTAIFFALARLAWSATKSEEQ